MSQSFFVVSGENVELAKDEVIAISKSYDKKTSYKTDSRLVITNSQVPWEKVAERTTFVRRAGKIADSFSDLFSEIDLSLLHKSDTFACRTINLSSKKLDTSSIEKTVGAAIKQISGTKVSLSNPLLTIYLIFTDKENYFGYAKPITEAQRPKKVFKFQSELPWKLCRAMTNLAGLNEQETLCDPFCGTGSILLEAESMGIKSIGIDYDKKMCNGARKNMAANGYNSKIVNAGYEYMQKIENKIDGIVTDLPYGISSKSSDSPKKLIHDFISILPKKKKIALMYKRELADQIELKPAKRYEIYRHKSLTRTILVK
ncbi:MAG: methyltransferase domain-containing protein [Thaumarchaeota archaeon]|nr:methyltransferase domain-containing protein [Nitrososphaerota archaeon]